MLLVAGLLGMALFIFAINRAYGQWLMIIPWWRIHSALRLICWMVAVLLAIVLVMHFMPSEPISARAAHSAPLAR